MYTYLCIYVYTLVYVQIHTSMQQSGETPLFIAKEEEDLGTFTVRMKALPVAELRKACGLFKLSDKGSKLEMIARLHAHAQEQNNMDVGDSQEEDEEEEEEKKKNLPPPKASPKCKKAASPGPVKTIAKTRKAGAKARK